MSPDDAMRNFSDESEFETKEKPSDNKALKVNNNLKADLKLTYMDKDSVNDESEIKADLKADNVKKDSANKFNIFYMRVLSA